MPTFSGQPNSEGKLDATMTTSGSKRKTHLSISYNSWRNEGDVILLNGARFEVKRSNKYGGWNLIQSQNQGNIIATATKVKMFGREMAIETGSQSFRMVPKSMFKWDFDVVLEPEKVVVGSFHAVSTSKSQFEMSFEETVGTELQGFIYWIINRKIFNSLPGEGDGYGGYGGGDGGGDGGDGGDC